jgi:hypothetical protein
VEWIIGIIVVVAVLWAIGRAKGAPDPATQSDGWIHMRLRTEGDWINKYLRLPYDQQQSESLKKMYTEKVAYFKSMEVELQVRGLAAGIGAVSKELQPIVDRAAELEKTGISKQDALRSALQEWKNKGP